YVEAINRHPLPRWRLGLDGLSLDSLGGAPEEEQQVRFPQPGTRRHSPVLFGKGVQLAASERRIYVAPTDDYSIRVLDAGGILRGIVRRDVEPRRVAAGDVARFI